MAARVSLVHAAVCRVEPGPHRLGEVLFECHVIHVRGHAAVSSTRSKRRGVWDAVLDRVGPDALVEVEGPGVDTVGGPAACHVPYRLERADQGDRALEVADGEALEQPALRRQRAALVDGRIERGLVALAVDAAAARSRAASRIFSA